MALITSGCGELGRQVPVDLARCGGRPVPLHQGGHKKTFLRPFESTKLPAAFLPAAFLVAAFLVEDDVEDDVAAFLVENDVARAFHHAFPRGLFYRGVDP